MNVAALSDSQLAAVALELKRRHRLRYSEIAAEMNLHISSVQRIFTGKGGMLGVTRRALIQWVMDWGEEAHRRGRGNTPPGRRGVESAPRQGS